MKTDNRMAKAVGLLVLSLLFAGIFMAAQRRGEFQAQAYPFGVWIQSEGLCTLSTDDQITDAAISEQDLHASSISSFLRHSMSLRIYENRDCVVQDSRYSMCHIFNISFCADCGCISEKSDMWFSALAGWEEKAGTS